MTIKGMTSKAAVLPAAATAAAGTPRQAGRKGITVISRRIVIAAAALLTAAGMTGAAAGVSSVSSHPHSTVARPPSIPTGSGDVVADRPTGDIGNGGIHILADRPTNIGNGGGGIISR